MLGGAPTILSATFAHLIRSTGESGVASFGMAFGAVMNIVLDPIFMFVLLPPGNEVMGAGICGLPGFCMISVSMISNCFLNALLSGIGSSAAVAGLGIVRKIDSLSYAVNQGITQGMLPLVGYCYASGNKKNEIGGWSFNCQYDTVFACRFVGVLVAGSAVGVSFYKRCCDGGIWSGIFKNPLPGYSDIFDYICDYCCISSGW